MIRSAVMAGDGTSPPGTVDEVTSSLPPLTSRDRRALRTAITDELARVDDQIVALRRTFDDIVEANVNANSDDEHDPDGTTVAFERAQVSALLRQAEVDRDDLRANLDRLDRDDFGVCEVCTGFIGAERLMALPTATRCITCAQRTW